MTAETLPLPADTDADEDLTHAFCECDPRTAMCGADLTGAEEVEDEQGQLCVLCVVLLDASGGLCGRCGQ